jgi:peroxiredoxin
MGAVGRFNFVTPPTLRRPEPDHLEELFNDLRTTHRGGQRPPRAIWLPVVFILTFGALGLLAWGTYLGGTHLMGLNDEAGVEETAPVPTVADLGPAPTIGPIVDWAIVDGSAPTGRVVVLQIWTDTSCPGCAGHALMLRSSHRDTDRGFEPLWIFSTNDPEADFEEAAAQAEQAKVEWAVGWDPTGRVADSFAGMSRFQGEGAVSTYIIDQDSRLRYAVAGAPQDVQLQRLVRELTDPGSPPEAAES